MFPLIRTELPCSACERCCVPAGPVWVINVLLIHYLFYTFIFQFVGGSGPERRLKETRESELKTILLFKLISLIKCFQLITYSLAVNIILKN